MTSQSSGPGRPTQKIELDNQRQFTPVKIPSKGVTKAATATTAQSVVVAKPKTKRVPAEGSIIPDRGWPKFKYDLWKLIGRPDKVPKINNAQQVALDNEARQAAAAAAHQAKLDYRGSLITRLRELANLGISPVVCVVGIKSCTKSATAIGFGTVSTEYTRKKGLLVPTTTNTATATVGRMTGVKGKITDIEQFLAEIKEFSVPRTLNQRVPLTPQGLAVVVESRSTAANEDDHDKVEPFMEAIDLTLPNVDLMILDLGNDNISKWSVALQAARLAHVLVFAFNVQDSITYHTLRETFDGFSSDTGIPDDVREKLYTSFENKPFTGLDIPMRDKVARSVVVATKADGSIDFSNYARTNVQSASAEFAPVVWNGTGISVPFDPVWTRRAEDGEQLPFDYDLVQLDTDIAYLQGAVAMYEQTGLVTGVDIGQPMIAGVMGNPTQKNTPQEFTEDSTT